VTDRPPFADTHVRLAHGAGGPAMRALIDAVFLGQTRDPAALARADAACLPFGDGFLVITTDAHVVSPPEFPGGDIGRLSICGVVNDLAMAGACDVTALTSCVVLEEGFPLETLRRLHASVEAACAEAGAGARVVAGDTKVMRRGELDGVIFSTTGVAFANRVVRDDGLRPGDALLITGTIGDHGLTVLSARHGLGLEGELRSDVAPLNGLVKVALAAGGVHVHAMKDPTRGGVTGALTEMAEKAGVAVRLREAALPMTAAARAAAELLGIDPLIVANEGKALIAVAPEAAGTVLAALRAHPLGHAAAHIGEVVAGPAGELLLDTGFGTRRLVSRDADPLPRIC
jgi:hydrogenase expression/formation protein HypE